jgi:hypothetical protein
MASLKRKQKTRPVNLPRERYELPELDPPGQPPESFVWVRALSSKQLVTLRDQYPTEQPANGIDFCLEIISLCAEEDDGSRLYESPAEVKEFLDVSKASFEGMAEKAMQLGGIELRAEGKN